MNKAYQELIRKSEECELKAIAFYKANEMDLAAFYKNASIGYKQKALNLS